MSSELLNPLSSINAELADRLEKDDAFRRRYIRMWAQTEVASEIRSLRKRRRLRQSEVATLTQTGQSAISRIERADYDGWTYKTLIAIACELKARLRISYEPIEVVADGYRSVPETASDVQLVESGGTSDAATTEAGSSTASQIDIFSTRETASKYSQQQPF